jgi:hypothetical protein
MIPDTPRSLPRRQLQTIGRLSAMLNQEWMRTVESIDRRPVLDLHPHQRELDLPRQAATGVGDVPLVHLPLRCSACDRHMNAS